MLTKRFAQRVQSTRRLEQLLLLAGFLGAVWCSRVFVHVHEAQAAGRNFASQSTSVDASAQVEQPLADGLVYGSAASRQATGAVIGRIEVPQLQLSVPMIDGVAIADLQRGAGHIPGTALPGGLGTVGLAAHRDTFFRPLRRIAPGMHIHLTGRSGTFDYQVVSTEIVLPEQVSVLDVADHPQLTLVTCYPFNYVGAAPKRFIVRATLNSLDPLP